MFVDYKEVGRRIASRRKELGYKQSEVNEMADLSDKYLSNIERATSVMSIDVLMKLCEVLKTTPDNLLLGTSFNSTPTDNEIRIGQLFRHMTEKQIRMSVNLVEWLSKQEL